ncbi:ROK family protein [Vagococcus sp.]|uniref:ROK family protein n=1 Tax=Vagococcus sp. TaxID=1933889 RepID=UPI000EEEC2B1|nr:ROK family protein [Vagococcus sp.]HCT96856.1 fructokinase [Vagococcus sp.]
MTKWYGAIEAGGTKFVCAVSDKALEIKERVSIPTENPETTIQAVFDFFDQYALHSIGVGSFGPIDVNPTSKTYGHIMATPKPGWEGFDFVGALKNRYHVPIAWTTDVNAAAYGELHRGAAQGTNSCIYLTIGTGVGGGAVVNGQVLEGFSHPEMGHIQLKRLENDTYQGKCPYHSDCLEGLVAGPALGERTGKPGAEIEEDDAVWETQAYYIAQGLMAYTLVLSPERIILGGGVMKQAHLFPLIRESFEKQMADYVVTPDLEDYIVPTGLGDNSGITGCLLLSMEAK